ncbi:MAG: hypothetical protein KDK41_16655 [Leptospiraceae bacterium]|nr:hypothetical protein [Leptospiraceae bacterium]MCB1202277.1 hypothetical protein [Leptospiraceae bacterium]
MSAAKNAYFRQLEKLVDETIFVGSGIDDLQEEIHKNILSFDVNPALARECSVSDFLRYIDLIVSNRRKQIKTKQGRKMKFFLWFDKSIGKISFNLISNENTVLPFDKPVVASEMVEIFAEFLEFSKGGNLESAAQSEVTTEKISVYSQVI